MGRGAAKGALQGAQDGLLSGMVMGGLGGASQALSGHSTLCFVAGTTILTVAGRKAIETIEIGDVIPCVDHITGESAEKRVVTTTVNKVTRLIELDIDGEIIQCTETHPFQVKDRGWVHAMRQTISFIMLYCRIIDFYKEGGEMLNRAFTCTKEKQARDCVPAFLWCG